MAKKLRKISIVVEDQSEDRFIVYLEGDKERMELENVKDATPAELWAARFFNMCRSLLERSKSIELVETKIKEVH